MLRTVGVVTSVYRTRDHMCTKDGRCSDKGVQRSHVQD